MGGRKNALGSFIRNPGFVSLLALIPACTTMKTEPVAYVIQEKTMTLEAGMTLRYTLALPPSFSPDEPYPLILALHYGGKVIPYYGKPYLANLVLPALRELAAIMFAPDCPAEGWTDPLSEKAVLALLQKIQQDYSIDRQRLVITGYSLGAIGTWDFVLKHPRLFSAAIPVSGMPPKGIVITKVSTPFWVIHSFDDELFPLESVRKFVQFCEDQGLSVQLRPVAGINHYDFDRYVPALREVVPWVKSLWKAKAGRE